MRKGLLPGLKNRGARACLKWRTKALFCWTKSARCPSVFRPSFCGWSRKSRCVRIGSSEPVFVDVRILAATNRDLKQMVARKEFRKDLFFRLNVVPVHIPPLRQRREAIPGFVQHFLKQLNEKYGYKKYLSPRAMDCLCDYDWPGNVRELENMIERVVVVTQDREISLDSLPARMIQARFSSRQSEYHNTTLKAAMDQFEKSIISQVLSEQGSTRKAARILGVNQSTVCRKAARYGIQCG